MESSLGANPDEEMWGAFSFDFPHGCCILFAKTLVFVWNSFTFLHYLCCFNRLDNDYFEEWIHKTTI